jgi:predicted dehydrogenase
VGAVGLELEREPLYAREADVLISTSYGPGRYDPSYEEGGVDYPVAYVRWTENRNMEEVLRLLATGELQVGPLIELERPVERAAEAYAAVNGPEPPLAAVLTYDAAAGQERGAPLREVVRTSGSPAVPAGERLVRIALVGAGGFVSSVHVPNIKSDPDACIQVVVNSSSASSGTAARRVGAADAMTDWQAAIARDDVDMVVIGTRHDSHAEIATAALREGKAVFVEKPLGLSRDEIDSVWAAGAANDRLAIGFNRPFAPLARTMEAQLREAGGPPVQLVYRVSAPLDASHWLNDPAVGGGRLQGEACHMFDFANWLCGVPARVWGAALPAAPSLRTVESASVIVAYHNGSVAAIHYSGAGAPSMPKERIEVLAGGRSWVLDDFVSLTSYSGTREQSRSARRPDKGHAELMRGVLAAARGEREFEPGLAAAYAAQSVALAALESIASGKAIDVIQPAGAAA